LSDKEIAKLLGISGRVSGLVSDRRKLALERGYLTEIKIANGITKDEKRNFQKSIFDLDFQGSLQENLQSLNLKRPIDELYVFDTRNGPTELDILTPSGEWDARVKEIGRLAAPLVSSWLLESEYVGCSFGRQLASLARGLRKLPKPKPRPGRSIEVFPVLGDICIPAGNWDEPWSFGEITSTGVAAAISSWLNPAGTKSYNLSAVPILRPSDCREETFEAVKEFYSNPHISSHRDIFEHEGLARKMDCLLTTIGGPIPEGRFWTKEFFSLIGKGAYDMARDQLLGDVGGVWLPKLNKNGEPMESDFKQKVESSWTCLDGSMIRTCYDNARRKDKIGVVAICVGEERAETAFAAAASGTINRLLLDNSCAERLAVLLRSKSN
jgi:DNA-binding transcriptional regulator LsrR (DeoR family)